MTTPGDPDVAKLRKDLLDQALLYSSKDYDFLNGTYGALDSKAQATFGVAGLFIAGTVALLGTLSGPDDLSTLSQVLIVATYVLLVGAVLCSVASLRVRQTNAPLRGSAVSKMTLEFIDLPDEEITDEMRTNWYREQLRVWDDATQSIEAANGAKARWLTVSQITLLVAIVCAGIATMTHSLH
jgi:hypothetical protein